jgi:hypothetical protein
MRYINSDGYKNDGALTEVEVLTCSKSTDIAEPAPSDVTEEPDVTSTPAVSCSPPPQKPDTSGILGKCGTLIDYDPINGRTDPEVYGVSFFENILSTYLY